ncbi:hypothetical protein [Kribbella sp. CA-294648]|uniref:hypothetical protein n=1 Tax=Kribbella sp. CA-294648 TaxID=3239948 RepID=UPI003D8CBC9E
MDDAELQLRAAGIQHAQAAINEAALPDEGPSELLDASTFDPCAVRLAPTDLVRRRARGRAVAISVTSALAVAILVSLIALQTPS